MRDGREESVMPDIGRKRIAAAAATVIAMAAVIFLFAPAALGASDISDANDSTVIEMLEDSDMNEVLDDVCSILMGTESNFIETVIGTNGTGTVLMSAMQVLGISLMGMFILMEVLQEMSRGTFGTDAIMRVMTKMVIACLLIIYAADILEALDTIGDYLVALVKVSVNQAIAAAEAAAEASGASTESIATAITKLADSMSSAASGTSSSSGALTSDGTSALWTGITDTVSNGLTWLLGKILTLTVKGMSYALFMELAIRKAFMPLAMASAVNGGGRDPGFRYIKKYFSVYLKMGIIIVTIACCVVMVNTTQAVSNNALLMIYEVYAIKIAALQVIRNGTMFADEIMGVGRF